MVGMLEVANFLPLAGASGVLGTTRGVGCCRSYMIAGLERLEHGPEKLLMLVDDFGCLGVSINADTPQWRLYLWKTVKLHENG